MCRFMSGCVGRCLANVMHLCGAGRKEMWSGTGNTKLYVDVAVWETINFINAWLARYIFMCILVYK